MILHTGQKEIDQDRGLYIVKSQKMFLKDKVEIISLSVLDHNIWYHITLPCSWVRHETPPHQRETWDMGHDRCWPGSSGVSPRDTTVTCQLSLDTRGANM